MPDLGNRFGQNPSPQYGTVVGDRQLGRFAFEPPNQKHEKPDHYQAENAGKHELHRSISKAGSASRDCRAPLDPFP